MEDKEFLFVWSEDEKGEWVKSLIYFLKSMKYTSAFQRLASLFTPYKSPLKINSTPLIFIPAPPREKGAKDHAYRWAYCLSQLWQGKLVCALERKTLDPQKTLSLQQRHHIQMKAIEDIDSQSVIIFCDDLVTTGATAQSAWRALGKPSNYFVWAIAYRPAYSLEPK